VSLFLQNIEQNELAVMTYQNIFCHPQ